MILDIGLPDVEGFEVLVGKGDAENDALTFEVADPLCGFRCIPLTPNPLFARYSNRAILG